MIQSHQLEIIFAYTPCGGHLKTLVWRHFLDIWTYCDGDGSLVRALAGAVAQFIEEISPNEGLRVMPQGVHPICAMRDTLNFFLGLSLNFSKILLGLVSYSSLIFL